MFSKLWRKKRREDEAPQHESSYQKRVREEQERVSERERKRVVRFAVILGVIALVALVLLGIFVPQFFHWIAVIVRYIWLPGILIGAFAVGAGWLAHKRDSPGIAAAGVTVFAIACIVTPVLSNYFTSVHLREASQVKQTEADDLSFDTRPPYDVAVATSNRSLGDTNGESTGTVKSNPAQGTYSVSIVRRGIGQGYESVQVMDLPEFGSPKSGDVTFCDYDENASLRLGGMLPGNSLNRAIALKTPLDVHFDSGDAIATCEGEGQPMLYVPLKRPAGVFGVYEKPAGVAIYNGKTGELTIEDEVKDAEAPIYPQSIVEAQRESLKSSNGFADWIFGRAGYETTDKGDDPNGSNATEFALRAEDGDVSFYTPLTPRGSSSSIVGLASVESTTVKSGELNPLTVARYETPRKATSTVAADIISGTLSGYKASGLTVFEVVPGPDGTWVASIGKNQSILYRASIDPEGGITLLEGEKPTADEGKKLELTTKPLEDMTPDELKQLGDEVLEELAARSEG